MIKQKEIFFGAIWRDYKEHADCGRKEDAFVYRYMRTTKMNTAGKVAESAEEIRRLYHAKKKDQFVMLHAAGIAWKNGIIAYDECARIVRSALSAREQKKYGELSDIIMLEEAIVVSSTRVLMDMVRDFFRDLGYLAQDSAQKDPFTAVSRKNYEILEMLLEYYQENGEECRGLYEGSFSDDILQDRRYIAKCQSLYEELEKDKRSGVFMPLYVDCETGAGIYIIGAEHYENAPKDKSCRIVCLAFWDIQAVTEDEFLVEDDCEKDLVGVCAANIDMKELGRYDSVEKAFRAFTNYLENTDYIFHREYASNNWMQKPEKEPDERFLPFFMESEDLRRRIIAQKAEEERLAFAEYMRSRGIG